MIALALTCLAVGIVAGSLASGVALLRFRRSPHALQQELSDARAHIAAFVPVGYHLNERWHYADRGNAWLVEFTYKKAVRFNDWPTAQAAIREIRADMISARMADSTVEHATHARTSA